MILKSDKRKVIEHIVRNIYLPELKKNVQEMINAYTKKMITDIRLTQMLNIPTIVNEPVLFKIAEPTEKLITNLMIIFDDEQQNRLS